jgi:nitrogen fixation protein NifU and related proteins
MSLEQLYQQVILDHYRTPRNKGEIPNPTVDIEGYNPLCGDKIHIQLLIGDDRKVKDVKFHGQGCSISQASASMMTQKIVGKTVEEALLMREEFKKMMEGKEVDQEGLGDLVALQGVSKFPVRIKCALLAWASLKQGIDEFNASNGDKKSETITAKLEVHE